MAKKKNKARKSARQRASTKKAQKQRQQQIVMVSAASVIVIGAILYFLLRPAPPPQIDRARLELDPRLGPENALVQIVEYGAYACHSCQALHLSGEVEHLIEQFPGQVSFVFRDFPFIIPTYDHMAAEVAQCVLDQDEQAFWDFHDLLYRVYFANRTRDQLVTIAATEVGNVSEAELSSCVEARTHFNTVEFDADRGLNLGIRGTPTIYVNGRQINPFGGNLTREVEAILNS